MLTSKLPHPYALLQALNMADLDLEHVTDVLARTYAGNLAIGLVVLGIPRNHPIETEF